MISLEECNSIKGGVWGICPACGDFQFVHKWYDNSTLKKIKCQHCKKVQNAVDWKTEIGPAHWCTDRAPSKIAAKGNVTVKYAGALKHCINPTYEELFDWVNGLYNPFADNRSFFEGVKHVDNNVYEIVMSNEEG